MKKITEKLLNEVRLKLNALVFDDDDYDGEDMQMQKISSKESATISKERMYWCKLDYSDSIQISGHTLYRLHLKKQYLLNFSDDILAFDDDNIIRKSLISKNFNPGDDITLLANTEIDIDECGDEDLVGGYVESLENISPTTYVDENVFVFGDSYIGCSIVLPADPNTQIVIFNSKFEKGYAPDTNGLNNSNGYLFLPLYKLNDNNDGTLYVLNSNINTLVFQTHIDKKSGINVIIKNSSCEYTIINENAKIINSNLKYVIINSMDNDNALAKIENSSLEDICLYSSGVKSSILDSTLKMHKNDILKKINLYLSSICKKSNIILDATNYSKKCYEVSLPDIINSNFTFTLGDYNGNNSNFDSNIIENSTINIDNSHVYSMELHDSNINITNSEHIYKLKSKNSNIDITNSYIECVNIEDSSICASALKIDANAKYGGWYLLKNVTIDGKRINIYKSSLENCTIHDLVNIKLSTIRSTETFEMENIFNEEIYDTELEQNIDTEKEED